MLFGAIYLGNKKQTPKKIMWFHFYGIQRIIKIDKSRLLCSTFWSTLQLYYIMQLPTKLFGVQVS